MTAVEISCKKCGRTGTRGFDDKGVCKATGTCSRRAKRVKAQQNPKPAVQVSEPTITMPPPKPGELAAPRDDEPDQSWPDQSEPAEAPHLRYHERGHRYYLNGKRAKGVSTIAKIAADDYNIRLWHERMVAAGVTIDENLRENVAMHIENREELNNLCEDAKKIAKAHLAADRGSQKHRVLELVLTGQEHKLITPQQREDAVILKRTLDRYCLTPHGDLAEQFIIYPDTEKPDEPSHVCGRFDAVLDFEKPDGTTVLVDLKSGENAVLYPHATVCQLAMYTMAPYVSFGKLGGSVIDVNSWRTMPDRLIKDKAYVLLVTNEGNVGTLHELNIEHGWKAAQLAMNLIRWRRAFNYGDYLVVPVNDRYTEAATAATTSDELRAIWRDAAGHGCLDTELAEFIKGRNAELAGGAANASAATA